MEYKDFLAIAQSSTGLRPGTIRDIYLRQNRLITEIGYGFQDLISAEKDVIFSFYIPEDAIELSYLKINCYLIGLKETDYPDNSKIIYLPYLYKGTPVYKNGSFSEFGQAYYQAGTGVDGINYYWYRAFTKFNISPLLGLKLKTCQLKWLLASKVSVGSGPNTEHSLILHAIDDYGELDKNDWGMTAKVNYGTVNVHTDETGIVYSKDVKTQVQSLIDKRESYAAFRFISSGEPDDIDNANNYRLNEPLIYCELEENTEANIGLYVNDGKGFGKKLISFNSDIEDTDLEEHFSGVGKKQIKLNCSNLRRIEILIRIGIRLRR